MAFNFSGSRKKEDQKSGGKRPATAENTTLIMSGLKKMSSSSPGDVPFIGHLPVEKQYILTMISGLAFLVITGLLLTLNAVQTSNKTGYITRASEMQMLTQRLSKSALQSLSGNHGTFTAMKESQHQFNQDLHVLINGGLGLPPSPSSVQPILAGLQKQWQPTNSQLLKIASSQSLLENTSSQLGMLLQQIGDLVKLSGDVASRLNGSGSPAQAALANQLVGLTVNIGKNTAIASRLVDQPEWRMSKSNLAQDQAILKQIRSDIDSVQSLAERLRSGSSQNGEAGVSDSAARSRLAVFEATWKPLHEQLPTTLDQVSQVLTLKRSSLPLLGSSDSLYVSTQNLAGAYKNLGVLGNTLAIITGLLALTSLVLFGFVILNESRRRVFLSEAENKRNQEAILRLLNELGDLADGDLTANATVTEDITGAIADSINFTIDELRNLVSGINHATEQVTGTTLQAQAISEELLAAAQRQSQEIENTSADILGISQSINEVSASANQSAQVATQSLEAAEQGARAVENSIAGMNSIRENIQETSKRIKRLGESSQEIGEIVELISDITEQTNVLALNAAIQAAAAGEAGRGFSVVAEEVQRLAERSAQATKQISAIVKTIQSDTQDAVSAMETSTQGVVEGARLSDAAGQALHEIDQVSRNLATLIRSISAATENQTVSASKVAQAMQQIRQITEQTTAGTQQTASSIGELSALASDLKKSISGFKLG